MSSFPLPDNSSITSSPETPCVEHSTLRFNPITTSRGKESVGPEPELQAILERAMEATAATGAAIALSTEDGVCCRASTGAAPEVGTHLHAGISLTELCLETGQVLLCNDTSTDRRVDPRLCKEMDVGSVLVSPITQNAKAVGVLLLLSIHRNAFNQHDETAMSKLADGILRLPFMSSKIPDRCLDQLPSNHIETGRDLQKLLARADVLKEPNNPLPTTDAAEAAEWNEHYIGLQLPDQPVAMTSQEHPSGVRWLTTGLATALALVFCGYGYHLTRPRVATNVAILPISAANHKPAIPNQQYILSEQDEKTNGQPTPSHSVLTATREEVILAIQEPVQGTDVNHVLNRAGAGDSIAQYEMALRYADGEGVPQSYRDAMAWFSKAAANGNDKAEWKLGLGYIKGIGVPHDERKAVVWFKRAANYGNIRAQSALSDLYLNGRGVPRDYVRAYTWATIATGLRGNDNDQLGAMGSRMTAVQIEDAHRRISSWRERQTLRAAQPVTSQRTAVPEEKRR
jgi:GAF domain/Sel1 repeat